MPELQESISVEPPATVAVVIVSFNAGRYLEDCLEALKHQTRKPDRVVVVDNNSTDNSLEIGRAAGGRVVVLPLSDNTGFAAGNNIATSFLDDFDYVALLNPDTRPHEQWLEKLMQASSQKPLGDCFGSLLLDLEHPETLDGCGDDYHVSGLVWRRGHGRTRNQTLERESIFSPCAAAALYHLPTWHAVGGFDETYFCYSEDVDLGFRMRNRGGNAWLVGDSVVLHAGSGITGKHSEFSLYHGHRNLVWTFFKNMPGGKIWRYLPQHLLMNLVTLVVFAFGGQGGVIWRAKRDAFKALPAIMASRRREQMQRRVANDALIKPMTRGWLTPYWRRNG